MNREFKLMIPEYTGIGIRTEWEDGFEIATKFENDTITIEANKEGLISLARHLLTLAQDNVPAHSHIHLDDYDSLETGSKELILEKIEAKG